MKIVLGLHIDVDRSDGVVREEENQFAEYLTETIRNISISFDISKKHVKFSSHTINMLMSLYLRSKKSYDDLCAAGLLCLPYPSILKNYKVYEDLSRG